MDNAAFRNQVASTVRYALWGGQAPSIGVDVYEELKKQTLSLLFAMVLPELHLPHDLHQTWQMDNYRQIAHNVACRYVQKELPVTVPYVVLKGTTAAQYYPRPDLRILGDIDIMPCREDFGKACLMLLDAGGIENTMPDADGTIRHRSFRFDGIEVEVHAYFAILNDPVCARYVDDLIVDNISTSHVLPDLVNGLVLLEHIGQHLEEGLGLRQIVDWMMFVYRCLDDDQWMLFEQMAERAGLKTLAVTVTRLCEIWLGLPERKWSAGADETVCRELMDYVFSCGNFGIKRNYDVFAAEQILSVMRTPKSMFKFLQRRGRHNWKVANRHMILRPFAWIYQIGKYINKGLHHGESALGMGAQLRTARKRNALFDALGVRQESKGLVIYKDGEYIKR